MEGSDAGNLIRNVGNRYTLAPGREAKEKTDKEFRDALPLSWQEGVFGFENPLLTEEEKQQYLQDIKDAGWRQQESDGEDIDEMKPEELRSLYPRQAGVRFQ